MVKRRKIRKNKEKDSPSEKRMKDKDGEVAIARGRLAGALKGILNRNNEDSDERDSSCSLSQSSNSSAKKVTRESSPAQWKKQSKGNETEDHQSYFMKLFDRSVDLAQFDINTPLFPICRAWIQNKPILSKKKDEEEGGLLEIKHDSEDTDSQLYELNEKSVTIKSNDSDVSILPPPEPLPEGVQTLRIPSPIQRDIEEINLNPDPDQVPSREELLQSHLRNWSEVRKRWRMACIKNEKRYAASKEILTKMFDRAQVQFHVPIN